MTIGAASHAYHQPRALAIRPDRNSAPETHPSMGASHAQRYLRLLDALNFASTQRRRRPVIATRLQYASWWRSNSASLPYISCTTIAPNIAKVTPAPNRMIGRICPFAASRALRNAAAAPSLSANSDAVSQREIVPYSAETNVACLSMRSVARLARRMLGSSDTPLEVPLAPLLHKGRVEAHRRHLARICTKNSALRKQGWTCFTSQGPTPKMKVMEPSRVDLGLRSFGLRS